MNNKNKFIKIFYGFGNLAYGVISQNVTNYYMFFGTAVLNLPGAIIGIIISISTLWDGLSDCIIGNISDKHKLGKLGNRNGYMLFSTIGMSVFNILIWFVPLKISTPLKFIWILLNMIILETFNTFFATPYLALGNELATNTHEKTSFQIYKTIFFLISIIIPSILMFIFLPNTSEYSVGQLNPYGYRKIAIILSVICLIFGLLTSILTIKKEHKKNLIVKPIKKLKNSEQLNKTAKNNSKLIKNTKPFNLKNMFLKFLEPFKNKNFKYLVFGNALAQITSTILTGVGMHFFTYCFLYSTKQITILLITLIMGTIISQPIWFKISKVKNKKSALIIGIYVSIIGTFIIALSFILRFTLLEYSYILALISIFICGIGSGSLYPLPISMFGDEIDKLNKKNNSNNTATYSGNFTFTSNIINAFALFFIGIILDLIKFNPKEQIQTLSVQTALAILLFVGIIVSFISSTLLFFKYNENN